MSIVLSLYLLVLPALHVSGESNSNLQVNNRFWVTRIKSTNTSELIQLAKRNGFRFHKKVSDNVMFDGRDDD